MENLTNLQISTLEVSRRNYLSSVLDAKMYMQAIGLESTIVEGNEAFMQKKSKAMIFFHHHIHESMKAQYLTIEDLLTLWSDLNERFGHQRDIFLPNAKHKWLNLRFQDYARVSNYNYARFCITLELKLCGMEIIDRDVLEKNSVLFLHQILSYNNNIKSVDTTNTMSW